MPKKVYQKFTEEEKTLIIARHKALVAKMNEALPDELKVREDPNIAQKLENEEVVAIYRIGEEMKAKRERQQQIISDLENRFGKPEKENQFTRSLVYGIKVEDTPEARSYNERMYHDYLNDRDRLAYVRYKDVINFNPQEIYEASDSKLKLAEYYREHDELVLDAYVLSSAFAPSNLPKGVRDALPSMTSPIETLNDARLVVDFNSGIDGVACPDISYEQLMVLMGNDDFMESEENFMKRLNSKIATETTMEDTKSYYQHFLDQGLQFEPGFFAKYAAVQTNTANKMEKEVPFTDVWQKHAENTVIKERSANQINQIKQVTRAYQREYQKIWQQKFVQGTGMINGQFNLAEIEQRNRGGFFERTFNTTSKEFKYLEKMFKDYNDPKNSDYLRDDRLRFAANAYLVHKHALDVDINTLSGTDKIRVAFARNVIDTCDKMDRERNKIAQQIDDTLMDGYGAQIDRSGELDQAKLDFQIKLGKDVNDNQIGQDEHVLDQSSLDKSSAKDVFINPNEKLGTFHVEGGENGFMDESIDELNNSSNTVIDDYIDND